MSQYSYPQILKDRQYQSLSALQNSLSSSVTTSTTSLTDGRLKVSNLLNQDLILPYDVRNLGETITFGGAYLRTKEALSNIVSNYPIGISGSTTSTLYLEDIENANNFISTLNNYEWWVMRQLCGANLTASDMIYTANATAVRAASSGLITSTSPIFPLPVVMRDSNNFLIAPQGKGNAVSLDDYYNNLLDEDTETIVGTPMDTLTPYERILTTSIAFDQGIQYVVKDWAGTGDHKFTFTTYDGLLETFVVPDVFTESVNRSLNLLTSVPGTLKDDDNEAIMDRLLSSMAEMFDEIKLYIDALSELFKNYWGNFDKIPKGYIQQLIAHQYGVELFSSENRIIQDDFRMRGTYKSQKEITFEFWNRILCSLVYILKTKGAIEAIKASGRAYGFPPSLLQIYELVSYRSEFNAYYNDVRNYSAAKFRKSTFNDHKVFQQVNGSYSVTFSNSFMTHINMRLLDDITLACLSGLSANVFTFTSGSSTAAQLDYQYKFDSISGFPYVQFNFQVNGNSLTTDYTFYEQTQKMLNNDGNFHLFFGRQGSTLYGNIGFLLTNYTYYDPIISSIGTLVPSLSSGSVSFSSIQLSSTANTPNANINGFYIESINQDVQHMRNIVLDPTYVGVPGGYSANLLAWKFNEFNDMTVAGENYILDAGPNNITGSPIFIGSQGKPYEYQFDMPAFFNDGIPGFKQQVRTTTKNLNDSIGLSSVQYNTFVSGTASTTSSQSANILTQFTHVRQPTNGLSFLPNPVSANVSGSTMAIYVENGGNLYTTTDNVNFTSRINSTFQDGVYALGQFIYPNTNYGNGSTTGILTSPDAITWTNRLPSLSADNNYGSYSIVATNSVVCIPVWNQFFTNPNIVKFVTSTNGINYTEHGIAFSGASGAVGVYSDAIASSTSTIAAIHSFHGNVYTKNIYTSTDGFTWTTHNVTTNADGFQTIAYVNKLFIALGALRDDTGIFIVTSTDDGATWNQRYSLTGDYYIDVQATQPKIISYSPTFGLYIITNGNNGSANPPFGSSPAPFIFGSKDGITWSDYSGNLPETVWNYSEYNNVGVVVGSTSSTIYETLDFANWTPSIPNIALATNKAYHTYVLDNELVIYENSSSQGNGLWHASGTTGNVTSTTTSNIYSISGSDQLIFPPPSLGIQESILDEKGIRVGISLAAPIENFVHTIFGSRFGELFSDPNLLFATTGASDAVHTYDLADTKVDQIFSSIGATRHQINLNDYLKFINRINGHLGSFFNFVEQIIPVSKRLLEKGLIVENPFHNRTLIKKSTLAISDNFRDDVSVSGLQSPIFTTRNLDNVPLSGIPTMDFNRIIGFPEAVASATPLISIDRLNQAQIINGSLSGAYSGDGLFHPSFNSSICASFDNTMIKNVYSGSAGTEAEQFVNTIQEKPIIEYIPNNLLNQRTITYFGNNSNFQLVNNYLNRISPNNIGVTSYFMNVTLDRENYVLRTSLTAALEDKRVKGTIFITDDSGRKIATDYKVVRVNMNQCLLNGLNRVRVIINGEDIAFTDHIKEFSIPDKNGISLEINVSGAPNDGIASNDSAAVLLDNLLNSSENGKAINILLADTAETFSQSTGLGFNKPQ